MFNRKNILLVSLLTFFVVFNSKDVGATEDTISQWTYNYFKKIHYYMEMERYEDAERELESLATVSYTHLTLPTKA